MNSNRFQLTTLEERIVKFLRFEQIPICFTAHVAERLKEPYRDVFIALENLIRMNLVVHLKVAGGDAWLLTKPRKGVKV